MSGESIVWTINWGEHRGVRGAVKIVLGLALVIGGVWGILSGAEWDGGLTETLGLAFFGGLAIGGGLWVRNKRFEDEIAVQGVIIEVSSYQSKLMGLIGSSTQYQAIYGYQVNGINYRIESDSHFESCPEVGQPIKIKYSASHPEKARRVDGAADEGDLFLQGVGMGLLVWAGRVYWGPYGLGVAGIVALVWGY